MPIICYTCKSTPEKARSRPRASAGHAAKHQASCDQFARIVAQLTHDRREIHTVEDIALYIDAGRHFDELHTLRHAR